MDFITESILSCFSIVKLMGNFFTSLDAFWPNILDFDTSSMKNKLVLSELSIIFCGTHFIYYITTNYYSVKETPAKTKTNRKTVNAMLQKSQTKTSSYICTIIEKLSLTFARYM